jgi:hypothetical protein
VAAPRHVCVPEFSQQRILFRPPGGWQNARRGLNGEHSTVGRHGQRGAAKPGSNEFVSNRAEQFFVLGPPRSAVQMIFAQTKGKAVSAHCRRLAA